MKEQLPMHDISLIVEDPRTPGRIRRIWLAIQEPRAVSLLKTVAYLSLGLIAGGLGFQAPPPNAVDSLGLVQTVWVAVLYVLGGLISALACLKGWWGFERAGLIFLIGATIMRVAAAAVQGRPDLWMFEGETVAMAWLLTARYVRIMGADLDPRH